jgi:hypothetical protein
MFEAMPNKDMDDTDELRSEEETEEIQTILEEA